MCVLGDCIGCGDSCCLELVCVSALARFAVSRRVWCANGRHGPVETNWTQTQADGVEGSTVGAGGLAYTEGCPFLLEVSMGVRNENFVSGTTDIIGSSTW